jgi:hypothetical protein
VTNKRIWVPALASVLVLGLLIGIGPSGSSASADPSGTTTQATTDPTTTVGTTTTGTTSQPPVGETTTQSTPASTSADPATTTTTPTAPCDTTQLTCGNNASTQVAIVSQTCNTSSANTVLNINIQTLSGAPVNNVTVNPQTSCLNELAITQVVEQYCVDCTVIVIPPPTVDVTNVTQDVSQELTQDVTNPTLTTTVENTTTTTLTQEVIAYCLPKPVVQPNGTISSLVYLDVGKPLGKADAGAVLASYKQGVGMVCPLSQTTLDALRVPMFTLTVPASYDNQYVRLCIQEPTGASLCHVVSINSGASISIPLTSNVDAKVVTKKVPPPKSKAQIAKASSAFTLALATTKTGKKQTKTKTTTKTKTLTASKLAATRAVTKQVETTPVASPTVTTTVSAGPSALMAGQRLSAGQSLTSPDGEYQLTMEANGQLVDHSTSGSVLWASDPPSASPGAYAEMEANGDLAIYTGAGGVIWESGTYGAPGAFLSIARFGAVVVGFGSGDPLWAKGTLDQK